MNHIKIKIGYLKVDTISRHIKNPGSRGGHIVAWVNGEPIYGALPNIVKYENKKPVYGDIPPLAEFRQKLQEAVDKFHGKNSKLSGKQVAQKMAQAHFRGEISLPAEPHRHREEIINLVEKRKSLSVTKLTIKSPPKSTTPKEQSTPKAPVSATEGYGYFYNVVKKKLVPLDLGSLGPHGDHDGWISLGDNAKQVGVQPKKAKAFQDATYGFMVPPSHPLAEFGDDFGGEFYVSDQFMEGEGASKFESWFKQEHGMSVSDAKNIRFTALMRVRQFPGSESLHVTTAFEEPDEARKHMAGLATQLINSGESPNKVASVSSQDSGVVLFEGKLSDLRDNR